MKKLKKLTFAFALSVLALSSYSQLDPNFESIDDVFGVASTNAVQAININYDNIETQKQLFHIFLPDTEGTFPLVVYIHGGGFTGGNPGSVFVNEGLQKDLKYFLDNGVAFASFGYRLISEDEPDAEGVIKSLTDSKRALQFVRHYAEDLHIDPENVAVMGSSAGAGTSLWLATRSDMADPNASDPVLRESTRVSAVVARGSQSTYDIFKWETDVYDNFDGQGTNFTLDSIAEIMSVERLSNFYGGIDSIYQIVHDPKLIQYREDVDMLFHLSSDDPPVYINSQSKAVHPSDDVLHHSLHGREIYETAIAAGVSEVKAEIPTQSINTTEGESANEFLLRYISSTDPDPDPDPEEVLGTELTTGAAIYPNPSTEHFFVSLPNETVNKVVLRTLAGSIVSSQVNLQKDSPVVTSNLPGGVYLVQIEGANGTTSLKRVVIQ